MGHIPSMFKLGKHYEYSADKDLDEAMKHYSMAAERGHLYAKKRLLHHKFRVKGGLMALVYWVGITVLAVKAVMVILRNRNDPRLIH